MNTITTMRQLLVFLVIALFEGAVGFLSTKNTPSSQSATLPARRWTSRRSASASWVCMKQAVESEFYDIDVQEVHPKLEVNALKHCDNWASFSSNHVVARHTLSAFEKARQFVDEYYSEHTSSVSNSNGSSSRSSLRKYVILDSGCGRGRSSVHLAKTNPDVVVIGLDRSEARLSKNYHSESNMFASDDSETSEAELAYMEEQRKSLPNLLLLRAELVDFWYLMWKHCDWTVQKHYHLYPNPYPKPKHLSRRWHGTLLTYCG